MVVKMMKWRPWPSQSPPPTRKYEVRLAVQRLLGGDLGKTAVEIRWKGPKLALSSLRRPAVKRNFTREVEASVSSSASSSSSSDSPNGVVWDDDEEFRSVCSFTAVRENVFHPWEIAFTVFSGLSEGSKNKTPIVGTALLNLSEHVSAAEEKVIELSIPLTPFGITSEPCPTLCISLSFVELRGTQETAEAVERSVVPVPSPPHMAEPVSAEKDELSALKAGLRKVKIFTGYVSSRKSKKTRRGDGGAKSDGDYNYPFDSDSLDDFEEGAGCSKSSGESDEVKVEDAAVRKSFSYGPLAYANNPGGGGLLNTRINSEDEDWVYYSHRRSDVGCSHVEDSSALISEPSLPQQSSKRGLLSWRKRKLSFRSPKAKGEPLLKKAYGEEGGDDIDFDRRQLSSDESLSIGRNKTEEDTSANRSSVSEFGDDNFAVGSWESKEVRSRDGHMKLQTQVFFGSIDQRSERAAGESACTALVAVIADWFQNNRDLLPIKSQFDSLIREGSLEWRNLCDNETYMERFPDKHFDLETVLEAKIRPLLVASQKSFIGFFHPEEMDEGRFDFLHGAMSFDNIWDEISRASSDCLSSGEPHVYIVSWNDHFFVLKVEPEAYYIVDTLGERLYEGCNQAYILKFDSNTVIHKISNIAHATPDEEKAVDQPVNLKETSVVETSETKPLEEEKDPANEEEVVVCQGKESCKEYIKSFLAAIPLRELQADMKKGLTTSTPIHQRLQIEFNFTRPLQPLPDVSVPEVSTSTTTTTTTTPEISMTETAT